MKYLLTDITIFKATNSRGEYKWLRGRLYNDTDDSANPRQLPFYFAFNAKEVEKYEPFARADANRPGTFIVNEVDMQNAINEGKIKDLLHISNIFKITVPLTMPYARIYSADVVNTQTGAIEHSKGEWVTAEGQTEPVPITELSLYMKKIVDNQTDETKWRDDPQIVARRILEKSYKPYVRSNTIPTPMIPQVSTTEVQPQKEMSIIDNIISTEATRQNVRLMLPVLVHWAKTGHNEYTYGDLIHAIGKPKFSGIGHALYAVQKVLDALSEETGREIPTLNSLCKNSKTMLPSEGFEFVSPKYNDLDEDGKSVFVEGLDSKAFNFSHWDWVLDQLGLKEAAPFTEEQLEVIKNPYCGYGGGEGEEHKALKEYICQHPDCLGYKDVVESKTEHILPSGDRLDVYFELSDGTHVAIEIKPSISPDQDIIRGIFQCVKYYAVMDALRTIECADYEIKVALVSACALSLQNKILAEELKVKYLDCFKPRHLYDIH